MEILIADDDPIFLEVVSELVGSLGHMVVAVDDGEAAWRHLLTQGADVVVSDWRMPGLSGVELCERLRAHPEIAYPYFILLTALGDRPHVLEALRAGVDDYMAKPLDPSELEGRLIVAERVRSLHLKILRTKATLEEAARRDVLTGLGNRLCLNEDLVRIHGRFVREGHSYNVVLFDIDRFKDYNDTHGHQAGDALLALVGGVIAAEIRDGDFAYRYGGEEFLIVLPSRTIEEAALGADRIRRRVVERAAASDLMTLITLSGGVAGALPGESPEKTIGRADAALYRAKNAGRDRLIADRPRVGQPRTLVTRTLPDTKMPNELIRPSNGAHLVEFYETDAFLVDSVRDYLAAGLAEGETVAVVATAAHQRLFGDALVAIGVDVATAQSRGQYLALDAAEMLATFMVRGWPDPAAFEDRVGGLIAEAGRDGRRVRVYGEMVAALWSDGMAEAAVALEDLWNDLSVTYAFALFCAYPASVFDEDASAALFHKVCGQHTRVIPSEPYTMLPGAAAQLREVAALQHQARQRTRAGRPRR